MSLNTLTTFLTSEQTRDWVHGPYTEKQWGDCNFCNYDTHACPGCGEWLYHGTKVCGPCELESAIGFSTYSLKNFQEALHNEEPRFFVIGKSNGKPTELGGRYNVQDAQSLAAFGQRTGMKDIQIIDTVKKTSTVYRKRRQ